MIGARPTAVVLDFDGTTVDSEGVARAAMAQVLAEDGHALTDADHDAVVGRAWPHTRAYLVELMGYDDDGIAAYRRRVRDAFRTRLDEVVVFDDVATTLASLRQDGVPLAVCTSSGREYLEALLERTGLDQVFDATVAREDTSEHKPDPAPYRLAARRLGVDPAACAAVEDTPAGVEAARAAGMRVLGVDRGLGLDLRRAHRVVRSVSRSAIDGLGAD